MGMSKLLFKKIIVLLAILIFLSLTTFNGLNFYKMLTDKPESARRVPLTVAELQSKMIPPPNTISQWHLMGIKSPEPIKAPKTTLQLKLVGIISSTVDGQARAIIEILPGKQKHFAAGDEIKKNVDIKSINIDYIVINHNSREEILPLNFLKSKKSIIKKVVVK